MSNDRDLGAELGRLDMDLEDPLSTVVHRYKLEPVGEVVDTVPELGDRQLLARTAELEVTAVTHKIKGGIEVWEITWSEIT